MGRLDVGQSVAVKEKAALAVEAIEGTDRCIERAGQLCRAGGWTLVKVAKPQQDMRFDVPTIGVTTIENLHKAGARVLAIEAGKTILLDQAEVVALADRYGLSIVAMREAMSRSERPHARRRRSGTMQSTELPASRPGLDRSQPMSVTTLHDTTTPILETPASGPVDSPRSSFLLTSIA